MARSPRAFSATVMSVALVSACVVLSPSAFAITDSYTNTGPDNFTVPAAEADG